MQQPVPAVLSVEVVDLGVLIMPTEASVAMVEVERVDTEVSEQRQRVPLEQHSAEAEVVVAVVMETQ